MPEFRVIGQRLPKVDALERVTGRARYGADIHLPGTLYGKVLRSPHAHAVIQRIDASRALALSGVKAVVTGADLPDIPPGTWAPQGELRIDGHYLSRLGMARDKALFAGHPVAAVAATDPYTAEEALGLIEVEYQVLPPVLDVLEAMQPGAPILHPNLRTQKVLGEKGTEPTNIATVIELGRGDVATGFAEADVVLEGTYRTQLVHQGYIEPEACTAQVEQDGHITVWTTCQGSFAMRNQLSMLFQTSPGLIRVVPMEIGGGFGGKIYARVEPVAIALAKKAGRPVKIVLTREEVLRGTGPGAAAVIKVKVGARRDGTLTAAEVSQVYDAGAFPGAPVAGGTLTGMAPYRLTNLRILGYDVVTSKPRVAAYRAPGSIQAAFAVEQQMDALAEKLGMDPVAFRLQNCPQPGDKAPNDMPFPSIGLRQVLERVKAHPAWTTPLQGRNRGRGLACGFWRGATNTSTCHLSVNSDGTVTLTVGSVDLTGTRTSLLQVCAEAMDMDPKDVTVVVGDTAQVGHTDVSGGSRITYSMGTAVHRACQDALRQLKERAAAQLKCDLAEVEYARKLFWVKGQPDRKVTVAELGTASIRGAGAIVGHGSAARMQYAPTFAVHVADVEVDPETGKVKLLRYTCFQDCGRAVNPVQVEGQMQGGATQGIGWALSEEYVYDDRGVLRNASLLDYRIPTALDVPYLDTEIIEVPASDGPYGVRGAGEVPIVPPAGCLANAICHATGVRLHELPMKPERVLWALKQAERKLVAAPAT